MMTLIEIEKKIAEYQKKLNRKNRVQNHKNVTDA